MLDGDHPTGWDRIVALIEECRAEREACAFVRERSGPKDSRYAAIRERLLSEVADIHAEAPSEARSS